MMIEIRNMVHSQWPEVAQLIHDSTNAWYENHGMPFCFPGGPSSTLLFCEVYEELDPNCCFIAVDSETEKIAGSCFWHPRTTHISLGIMNVHPDFFGRGIASRLLQAITSVADQQRLPVRLVSSAMNLDSFSLYNRAGFVPVAIYQDMLLAVNDAVIESCPAGLNRVRQANPDDIASITALEKKLAGIDRGRDWSMFVNNRLGIWNVVVAESASGELRGALASIRHPASNMIGPGISHDQGEMISMTRASLPFQRDNTIVMLVPSVATEVVSELYARGARNCELHVGQVRGEMIRSEGVVIPCFMPESG